MKLKRVIAAAAAMVFVCAAQATTYYWNAAADDSGSRDGNWSEAANWRLGDGSAATDYPRTADDIAFFSAGTTATVTLTETNGIRRLDLTRDDVSLTLKAADGLSTNATRLVAGDLDLSGARGSLTLDGVAVVDQGKSTNVRSLGSGFALALLNGADFYFSWEVFEILNGGKLTLKGGSTFNTHTFRCACDVEIDDSSLIVRKYCVFGVAGTASGETVANWRFVGKAPRCFVDYDFSAEGQGSPTANFEFLVPEGGYDAAPIYSTNPTFSFGVYNGAYRNATLNLSVSADSPAILSGETVTTPLVDWPNKGMDTNAVVHVSLPSKADSLVWGESVSQTFGTTQTFECPTSLAATLTPSATVVEKIDEIGAWDSLVLKFPASSEARTLKIARGTKDCGATTEGWDKIEDVATLAANATTYAYPFTTSWGSDYTVVRFFYVDADGTAVWTKATTWRDPKAPALGDVSVASTTPCSATLAADVAFVGGGVKEQTVSLVALVGASGAASARTIDFGATKAGAASVTLTGLVPGRSYPVRLVAQNDLGVAVTSDVAVVTTTAAATSGQNGPGLFQVYQPGVRYDWTKDYTASVAGTDWLTKDGNGNYNYRRELGVLLAYVFDSNYKSEVWGDNVYWLGNYVQYAYWGYMHLEKDKYYKFTENIDDGAYIKLTTPDGTASTVVINSSDYTSRSTSEVYQAPATGWYQLTIYVADDHGSRGGNDRAADGTRKIATNLGWTETDADGATVDWQFFLDDGTGSRFLTSSSAIYVKENVDASGKQTSLSLSFPSTTEKRTLQVVWDVMPRGDAVADWANKKTVTVAAGESAYTFDLSDIGWGTENYVVRFGFADGESVTWASAAYWRDDAEATVKSGASYVSIAGLNQVYLPSAQYDWTADYSASVAGTNWLTADDDGNYNYRRELGVIMAYVFGQPKASKCTSEIWGDEVYWPKNNMQWAYWGYMYLEKGKHYKFTENIDDGAYVKLTTPDGATPTELISDTVYTRRTTSAVYSPATTGWYPIEVRIADNAGDAGGREASNGSRKVATNLGWTETDAAGTTTDWQLLLDDGTGSRFVAEPLAISVAENLDATTGVQKSFALSFPATTAARTLQVVWGAADGGDAVAGWTNQKTVTVAAGESAYAFDLSDISWGTENYVVRFGFVSGETIFWAPSNFWHGEATPALDAPTLDGTGGDAIKVSGVVSGVNGVACTLRALTGASENAMTTVWEASDLADLVTTENLDGSLSFSFTICEKDAAAARCLKPGATYCVAVEATMANGKASVSPAASVTTAGAATWSSYSVSTTSGDTVTLKGRLATLGANGSAKVTLYWGTTADPAAMTAAESVTVTSTTADFTLSHVFPDLDATYYWCFRLENTTAGGTVTPASWTAAKTCTTQDSTVYTWVGKGADNKWSTVANWEGSTGKGAGYPNSVAATAKFTTDATVAFDAARTISKLDISTAGVQVKFVQATSGTAAATTKLTATDVDISGENVSLTLDGVALLESRSGDSTCYLGANGALALLNGADFYVTRRWFSCLNGGKITLKGGSTFSAYDFLCSCDAEIDDSTLHARRYCNFGTASTAKGTVVANWRFAGKAPHLYVGWNLSGQDAGAPTVNFEFCVPEGGYETPPVTPKYISYCLYALGLYNDWSNGGNASFNFSVADDSPAASAFGKVSTTLINWTLSISNNGIYTNNVTTSAGETGATFTWGEMGAKGPTTLGVEMEGPLFVTDVTDTTADIQVNLAKMGAADATSVKVLFGGDADALNREQTFEVSGDPATVTLQGLQANSTYAAKVVVTPSAGEAVTSGVLAFKTAEASSSGDGAVSQNGPGLFQVYIPSTKYDWTKDYSASVAGTNWLTATDGNYNYRRELGVLMAYVFDSNYKSEVWGDNVCWKGNGVQYAYWGYMHLEKDKYYKFTESIDDGAYIKLTTPDGTASTVVISNNYYTAPSTSDVYQAPATGWYAIDIRLADDYGSRGGQKTAADGSRKTATNLGWTETDADGTTVDWQLFLDDGTGSRFVSSASVIALKENVANGKWVSYDLTFPSTRAARTLQVVYGATSAGDVVADWDHSEQVTVDADAASYSYAVPATWGTEDFVIRFGFVESDGSVSWTASGYWHDASEPQLGAIALDGTGGDTLVVKGTVANVGDAGVTFKVLTGASEDELTTTWEGDDLKGLALSASADSGAKDFSFSLFAAKDTARYLAPGSTNYVCVVATANGAAVRSNVAKVTMSSAAKLASCSVSSPNRRTMTFYGQFSDLGMQGAATVTLWYGDVNDASSFVQAKGADGQPVTLTVTDLAQFSATAELPAFNAAYYWQWRVTTTSAGGTATGATVSDVKATSKTKDATVYVWTGQGEAPHRWADPANWNATVNGASPEDSLGYPQTTDATAQFTKEQVATVYLDRAVSVGKVDFSAATDADVTFKLLAGCARDDARLTVNDRLYLTSQGLRVTLDGVSVKQCTTWDSVMANGYGATSAAGNVTTLTLTNGAWYYMATLDNRWGGKVVVEDESELLIYRYFTSRGSSIVIRDATMRMRSGFYWWSQALNGVSGSTLRFEGTHPQIRMHTLGDNMRHFTAWDNGEAKLDIQFEVPHGGYASAPLWSDDAYCMGVNGNASGSATINVTTATSYDVVANGPLIDWANGINKAYFAEGALPKKSASFVWADENADGNPTKLYINIPGIRGLLLIIK